MNIPTELVKANKDDKQRFELLATAVLLKIKFSNSIAGKLNVPDLRKIIHCKHSVAQRILEGMKNSDLFDYNQRNGVFFVKTFKTDDFTEYRMGRRFFKAKEDYCKKIEIREYSLREMKRELRETLLGNMIQGNQREHVDSWALAESELENGCVTTAKNCALTQKQLASAFGMSRSSANRYIKRMEDAGIVSKSQIVAECAIPVLNDATLYEWKLHNPKKSIHAWHDAKHGGWSGWAYYGCMYSIVDRRYCECFKHVIWNHAKRTKSCACENGKMNTPDGEGYWSKFK